MNPRALYGSIWNADKPWKNFFFNTPIAIQHNISRILGFQRASLPSKYLGAPSWTNLSAIHLDGKNS
jgi:hypothetical protein